MSKINQQMTAKVWTLGNTTVRNPERIIGALKIYSKFYMNQKSFSSNVVQQEEFFDKLLKHSENGNEIIKGSKEIPFYSFITSDGSTQMPSGDYKQKNGRLWLSSMHSFGFINAYYNKSNVCNPGLLYIKFSELEGDVWLRQLLKFQYPNPLSGISGGASLRPGVILLKLMLELDGLSDFELSLCHLTRNENITELKKLINTYRSKRQPGKINELKDTILKDRLFNHYSTELEQKKSDLKNFLKSVSSNKLTNSEIESELDNIVKLGKGPNTPRAIQCKNDIKGILAKKDFNYKIHEKVLTDYYFLVKGTTISGDYPDLTKRHISMCRLLQFIRPSNGEKRLRVAPEFINLVKDAIDNLRPILCMKNSNDVKNYYQYLWDLEQPKLIFDDFSKVKKEIEKLKKELSNLKWKYNLDEKMKKLELISKERLEYNLLFTELQKAKEVDFAKNIDSTEIIKQLDKLKNDSRSFTPTELEGLIWKSLLSIGGYKGHPSETRNFHVDMNFESIFTAAGDQPDLQFDYGEFDNIVEVTKNTGKTQWRAESEPVTRHVATHKFRKEKETYCLFIAPNIHDETRDEFYQRSKGDPFIVQGEDITIKIVPLSFSQYFTLVQKITNDNDKETKWKKTITELNNIINYSADEKIWLAKIDDYITKM